MQDPLMHDFAQIAQAYLNALPSSSLHKGLDTFQTQRLRLHKQKSVSLMYLHMKPGIYVQECAEEGIFTPSDYTVLHHHPQKNALMQWDAAPAPLKLPPHLPVFFMEVHPTYTVWFDLQKRSCGAIGSPQTQGSDLPKSQEVLADFMQPYPDGSCFWIEDDPTSGHQHLQNAQIHDLLHRMPCMRRWQNHAKPLIYRHGHQASIWMLMDDLPDHPFHVLTTNLGVSAQHC